MMNRRLRNTLISSLLIFSLFGAYHIYANSFDGYSPEATPPPPKKIKVRNIIVLIGDGMGMAQIYAAYTAKQDNLKMFTCPNVGLMMTSSASHYITDSGAASTAMFTGKKTTNNFIGLLPNGDTLKTIVDFLRNKNISTGFVVASIISHATPAGLFGHNKDRQDYEKLTLDFVKSGIDVAIGGGCRYFNARKDSVNLFDTLKLKNYQIITDINNLSKIKTGKLVAPLYQDQPPSINAGRGDMLKQSTLKAIELLNQNKNGFFLMVEGSQIDWASHNNNTQSVIEEVIDFDNVVGAVLEYAMIDGETLVIVTADHETGGMTLTGGSLKEGTVKADYSTIGHSAVMVPVFSYGPGSSEFTGVFDNTKIFEKIYNLCGF